MPKSRIGPASTTESMDVDSSFDSDESSDLECRVIGAVGIGLLNLPAQLEIVAGDTYKDLSNQVAEMNNLKESPVALIPEFGPYPFFRYPSVQMGDFDSDDDDDGEKDTQSVRTLPVIHETIPLSARRVWFMERDEHTSLVVVRTPDEDVIVPFSLMKGDNQSLMIDVITHAIAGHGYSTISIRDYTGSVDVGLWTVGTVKAQSQLSNPTIAFVETSSGNFEFLSQFREGVFVDVAWRFLHSRGVSLAQRAARGKNKPLQLSHLARAIIHLIISAQQVDDNKQSGPVDYCIDLHQLLDGLENRINTLNYSEEDLRQDFNNLCGDRPGAVAIRQSFDTFLKLGKSHSDSANFTFFSFSEAPETAASTFGRAARPTTATAKYTIGHPAIGSTQIAQSLLRDVMRAPQHPDQGLVLQPIYDISSALRGPKQQVNRSYQLRFPTKILPQHPDNETIASTSAISFTPSHWNRSPVLSSGWQLEEKYDFTMTQPDLIQISGSLLSATSPSESVAPDFVEESFPLETEDHRILRENLRETMLSNWKMNDTLEPEKDYLLQFIPKDAVTKVAVKVLKSVARLQAMRRCLTLDDEQKRLRERVIWGKLNHPDILPLIGYAEGDERLEPFGGLISPWCFYGDVAKFLEQHGTTLTLDQRATLWKGIVEGVGYLHNFNPIVIHGDLKPANVLLDENGNPRICDFGLARLMLEECDSGLTTTSAHTGTARYLAYELVVSSDTVIPTVESDIYALGCVGLNVIFLRSPYSQRKNNALGHIFHDIRQGVPPAVHPEDLSDVEEDFWDILSTCWDRNPRERPRTLTILRALHTAIVKEISGDTETPIHSELNALSETRTELQETQFMEVEDIPPFDAD
ncbi:hypothetical protein FRC17_011185 [Serendipita sp. 399]|nr:hypothetical protein FRC17_011185 [Serendipita sp. 399]